MFTNNMYFMKRNRVKKFLDCTMICTMATTMVLSSLNVKVLAVGNSINETNIEEATRVSYYSFDDSNADDAWVLMSRFF